MSDQPKRPWEAQSEVSAYLRGDQPVNDDYPDEGQQPTEEWEAGYQAATARFADLLQAVSWRTLLDLPEKPTELDRQMTYIAAMARGLSDAEARAEGWRSE